LFSAMREGVSGFLAMDSLRGATVGRKRFPYNRYPNPRF
jgi:hypothetical protein